MTLAEAIEQIDIGGPSMLRAVGEESPARASSLCDPSLYGEFLARIRDAARSATSSASAARCACSRRRSAYDAAIAAYPRRDRPDASTLNLEKFQDLRYGENPHQTAGFYVARGEQPFEQLQGKELSYNNLLDLDSAIRLANAFARAGHRDHQAHESVRRRAARHARRRAARRDRVRSGLRVRRHHRREPRVRRATARVPSRTCSSK